MPHTQVSDIQRIRAKQLRRTMTRAETLLWRHLKADRLAGLVKKNLEGVTLVIAEAAEQAAPLSPTLPRKGGGSSSARASLTGEEAS